MKLTFARCFPASFPVFLLSVSLAGCVADCGPSEGETKITKPITAGEFHSVDLQTDCNVLVTEAQGQAIEVKGYPKAIDNLEFKVKNGVLSINQERNCNNNGKVPEIRITIPVVRDLSVGGSGGIKTTNTLAAENHKFEVTGSGNLQVEVNSKSVRSEVTGSGSLTLKGNSASADHDVTGSGQLHAFSLLTADADVEVTGSGSAQIWVNGRLKADVTGSGNVEYKGNPEVKQDVSGSGNVKKVE